MSNKTTDAVELLAKKLYELCQPEVPWEEADSDDAEAAIEAALAMSRLTSRMRQTSTARAAIKALGR